MPPAARITDMHTCPEATPEPHVGGPVISGSPNVFINGLPAARVRDPLTCVGPPDVIAKGSTGVFINGLPAARMGDLTAHGGVIIGGSPNVIIGEIGTPSPGFSGLSGAMAGLVMSGAVADALAHQGQATQHHHAYAPCTGKGMATPANEEEFAHDMKTLQKNWKSLTPDQRQQQMKETVNKQLSKSGVPTVGVTPDPTLSTSTNGQMNFQSWRLDMNPALLSSSNLSDKQTQQLGDTLFHESRHAEQWYLIARKEAADGKTAQQISQSTQILPSTSKAATAHPLPQHDPMRHCASQMFNSVYGTGAAHRDKVLTDLGPNTNALNKANVDYESVSSKPGSTVAEKQASYAKVQSAYRTYKSNYDQYRALPEEADAWHAGNNVGGMLGH